MAYEKTAVPVARSQEAVRTLLRDAGADRVAFGEVLNGPALSVGVEFLHNEVLVRVTCPVGEPSMSTKTTEQETRRVWRVLHWSLKARMESINEGLETFEQAFLPHIVDPASGRTLWQMVQPALRDGRLAVGAGGLGGILALGSGES